MIRELQRVLRGSTPFTSRILCALTMWLTGCVTTSSEGTDGSTHWVTCDVDADCDEGTCEDGRCSVMQNGQSHVLTSTETQTNALGGACVPGDEYRPNFGGYSKDEVSVSESADCASNVCVVNHFQGRITCPYGQTSDGDGDCRVPGTEAAVEIAVQPQLVDRPVRDAVFCSCRCAGPDADADFCSCGEGFECVHLIDDIGLDNLEHTGSFCVPEGTNVIPQAIAETPCDAETLSCGDPADHTLEGLGLSAPDEGEVPPASTTAFIGFIVHVDACLARKVPLNPGMMGLGAACRIYEAIRAPDEHCDGPARTAVVESVATTVREQLVIQAQCADEADCAGFEICEITQLTAPAEPENYASCLDDAVPSGNGWCYIDTALGIGTDVGECSEPGARRIRFVGDGAPRENTVLVMGCVGSLQ